MAYGERALFFDVEHDPEKRKEMLALTGGKGQVPVIVDGERVTIGFMGEASLRGAIPITGGT